MKSVLKKAACWGFLIYIFTAPAIFNEYIDDSCENDNFTITAATSNQIMVNPIFKAKSPKLSVAKSLDKGICLNVLKAEGVKTYSRHNQLQLTPSLICYKFPLSEQTVAG